MELRSNIEIGEDEEARRKSKKYSSKRLKCRRKHMRDKYSNSNINNVSGNIFNGPTNIVTGNNYSKKDKGDGVATYTPEPIWRSPITMALLTWISFFISLIDIFPLYKIFEIVINLFTNKNIKMNPNNSIYSGVFYLVVFAVIMLILVLILRLRSITKKETRYPLFFNYAISGLGRKLTIEKMHIEKCPICGGKMKYFNKPVKWRDITYSDGRTKHEIIKKVPALQCKRNSDHWFKVDPAADSVNKIGN